MSEKSGTALVAGFGVGAALLGVTRIVSGPDTVADLGAGAGADAAVVAASGAASLTTLAPAFVLLVVGCLIVAVALGASGARASEGREPAPVAVRWAEMLVLAAASLAVLVVAWLDMDAELIRESARAHHILMVGNAVAAPLAVLLFAAAGSLLASRRWLAGLVALPALPFWAFVLLGADTWLVRHVMLGVFVLNMTGHQPFGPTP